MSTQSIEVKKKARELKEDIENIKDDTSSLGASLAEKAKEIKDNAEEVFYDSVEGAKDKCTELQDVIINYCQEKPLKALGIALLTGFAAAYLIRK